MGAETASTVAEVRTLIHAEAMDGKGSADTVADIAVNGATTEDTAGVKPVVGNIPGVAEKGSVLADWQTMGLDVVSEVIVTDE